jgi:hypothetical protein
VSRDLNDWSRLGSRTNARTPGCVDREDRVSIAADHDVVEVAMNGVLVMALLIAVAVLVVAGVVILLRSKEPP